MLAHVGGPLTSSGNAPDTVNILRIRHIRQGASWLGVLTPSPNPLRKRLCGQRVFLVCFARPVWRHAHARTRPRASAKLARSMRLKAVQEGTQRKAETQGKPNANRPEGTPRHATMAQAAISQQAKSGPKQRQKPLETNQKEGGNARQTAPKARAKRTESTRKPTRKAYPTETPQAVFTLISPTAPTGVPAK